MCPPRTTGDIAGISPSWLCALRSSCCARFGHARGTAARTPLCRRDRRSAFLLASPPVRGNLHEAQRSACTPAVSETHAESGGAQGEELARGAGPRLEVSKSALKLGKMGVGVIVGFKALGNLALTLDMLGLALWPSGLPCSSFPSWTLPKFHRDCDFSNHLNA